MFEKTMDENHSIKKMEQENSALWWLLFCFCDWDSSSNLKMKDIGNDLAQLSGLLDQET